MKRWTVFFILLLLLLSIPDVWGENNVQSIEVPASSAEKAVSSKEEAAPLIEKSAPSAKEEAVPSNEETAPSTIIVQQGQNIRELAAEHLNNPNLWREILRINNLNSPADIHEGMLLKLPASLIQQTNNQIKAARTRIDEASKAGARVMAQEQITHAVQLWNQALVLRKSGEWEEAYSLAQAAEKKAKAALEIISPDTQECGLARLVDKKGSVQARKPSDQIWQNLPLNAVLAEQDRVRTLSESYAEILFQDERRVRLRENAQIIIRKNKDSENLSQIQTESKVTLVKGDAYKFLAGNHTDHKIEAPETLFLPAPVLNSPLNGTSIFISSETKNIPLSWEPVPNAGAYWLKIAKDRSLDSPLLNLKDLDLTRYTHPELPDGVYYWQVTALGPGGMPGDPSPVRFFKIVNDMEPPWLLIRSPSPDTLVSRKNILVSGEVEEGARVYINEISVEISQDQSFSAEYSLIKGDNSIKVKAIDRAGNTTLLQRNIIYKPEPPVHITYNSDIPRIGQKHFIIPAPVFSLSGRTAPGSFLSIKKSGNPLEFKCAADDTGYFQINIPLNSHPAKLKITGSSPGGQTVEDIIIAEKDIQPPEIIVSSPLVNVTSEALIEIRGRVSEKSRISLNHKEISMQDNYFHESIILNPGKNTITLSARDQAGNISYLNKTITLDQSPPSISGYQITPVSSAPGRSFEISVQAEDESALTAFAEFKIEAGDYTYMGFLTFNRSAGEYKGIVDIPENAGDNIRLSYVKLSDYYGHEKKWEINAEN